MGANTTELGSWAMLGPDGPEASIGYVREYVKAMTRLADFMLGDNINRKAEEIYRARINDALPNGVSLHGDQFYGPEGSDPQAIREACQSVCLFGIIADVDDDPEDWRQHRTMAETVSLFPAGRAVQHLNPSLADWRGVVEPTRRPKRHVEDGPLGAVVRVRWSATEDQPETVGWYSAAAIEPVVDPS